MTAALLWVVGVLFALALGVLLLAMRRDPHIERPGARRVSAAVVVLGLLLLGLMFGGALA